MIDETATWIPPMDVCEVDDSYILNAELPGVDLRDIKIDYSGSELTIKGDRRLDTVCATESYHRLESQRGRFHRKFSLPEPVDKNRIKLELKDGVLRVVLPKSGQTTKRLRRGSQ
jgi:HSP20 family protein